jgi:hypothetical protein
MCAQLYCLQPCKHSYCLCTRAAGVQSAFTLAAAACAARKLCLCSSRQYLNPQFEPYLLSAAAAGCLTCEEVCRKLCEAGTLLAS